MIPWIIPGANPDCDQAIEVETDGTYVSFSADTHGIGAALIKGSNATNVYEYDPQANSDSGLASPLNASGDPAGLSNVGGFCWNPDGTPRDPPGCYEEETAWSDGDRYNRKRRGGNWATYTDYDGEAFPVILFAGQHYDAGMVSFSEPDDDDVVTITIKLNEFWRFAMKPVGEDDEGQPIFDNNVKAQDYEEAPSGNPAPGQFEWKKFAEGTLTTIEVPKNSFYGVHVDVEHEVPCPE